MNSASVITETASPSVPADDDVDHVAEKFYRASKYSCFESTLANIEEVGSVLVCTCPMLLLTFPCVFRRSNLTEEPRGDPVGPKITWKHIVKSVFDGEEHTEKYCIASSTELRLLNTENEGNKQTGKPIIWDANVLAVFYSPESKGRKKLRVI